VVFWAWEGDRQGGSFVWLAALYAPRFAVILPPLRPSSTAAGSFCFAKFSRQTLPACINSKWNPQL